MKTKRKVTRTTTRKYPYLFQRADNGKLVEVKLTRKQFYDRVDCGEIVLPDGVKGSRDPDAERARDGMAKRGKLNKRDGAGWPMESTALSCHPSQVNEFRELAKKAGHTGIDFTKDGTCVIADRGARRDYLRFRGVHDRN